MMKKKRQYFSLLTAISIPFCASGLTGAPSAASLSFSAFDRIEAEDFSSMSGVEIEQLTGGGADVGYIQDGDYLVFNDVDFGEGARSVTAHVGSPDGGCAVEFYLDEMSGTPFAVCNVSSTGAFQTFADVAANFSSVSGKHDLYVKFTGGGSYLMNLDWFTFSKDKATANVPVVIKLGDLNGDGEISALDLSLAKAGALKSFSDNKVKKAADVDYSGTVDKTDIEWFVQYLTGRTTEFPERVAQPQGAMRTITEYTEAVKDELREYETNDSRSRKPGVTYPEVVKKQYFSKKANKMKNYNIMLPANYDESKQYPVLYLLHGFFEDEDRMILTGNAPPIPTREIITNAIAEGAAEEMIVVIPFVFTHATKENATGFGDYESSQGYDNFVDDIVDSLMPHIESTYSVATGRENTAVTGFSMGGRESLLIGFKYPDKFGYVGAICPAPGVQGPWNWASEEEAPSLLLLTAGSDDNVVQQGPVGYHNSLVQAGTPHVWHYVNGGYHGDNCIVAHIYNFCRWIFKA